MKNLKITPLPLYRNLTGKRLFEKSDPVFMEYRRRWLKQPLDFEAGPFPLFIDIEVTDACNLRCTFCATTHLNPQRERRFIKPELVYKILDEGKDNGLYGVKFNDRGEPLLHPNLFDFVRYAKTSGLVDVYFNTNAMLLTMDKVEDMIDSGLDRVSISVEGFEADFYEKYRVNGKFESLVMNVRNLWETRQKYGAAKPLVRIQTVLLPEIENNIDRYLEGYKKFWGPYADEIAVIEYKDESSGSCAKGVRYPWACHQLWQRMTVLCDGTILPCNEDNLGLSALGNIQTTTIKESWTSDAACSLRNLHRNGEAHLVSACDGCYLRNTQIKKLG